MTAPEHQRLSTEVLIQFIEALKRTGNVTLSSRSVGISPETAYRWKNRSSRNPKDPRYLISDPMGDDPDVAFHVAWLEAKTESLYLLRDMAMDLATGRHAEPVVYKGQISYEQDTSQDFKVAVDGTIFYPPKLDADGQPIPLMIHKVVPNITMDMLKSLDPEFKPKAELDITTQGKPIAVPERVVDMATFLLEFGRKPGG